MAPDEFGLNSGEALQEALGDEADLDVAMIGGELAADAAAPGGVHIHHPEVVGPGAEGVEGLLEGDFDFETQGIEADDLGWGERQIGGHEDQAAAGGMDDGDEAHEAAGGAPEQIARDPLQPDTLLAVGGALHGFQGEVEETSQAHLASVEPGTPPVSPGVCGDGIEGAGVALAPGNEVAAPLEESLYHLAAGVIGVGDQEHGLGQLQAGYHEKEFNK